MRQNDRWRRELCGKVGRKKRKEAKGSRGGKKQKKKERGREAEEEEKLVVATAEAKITMVALACQPS